MAQRRMFSPKIVSSDAFLDMPVSTQALYFHLGMYADDDGFVNPRFVMRMCGASEDDLKILLGKRFVLPFENGVIVIKHWKINNLIKGDRYNPTIYIEQKNKLKLKENGAYTDAWNQNGTQMEPQVRLGKVSIGKVSVGKDISSPIGEEAKPADKQYGNPEINECVSFFKAELDGELDDSVAGNRRYAKLLLDKFRKAYPDTAPVDNVQALIRAARKDKFHKRNATSFKYLYYNAQKIIQAKKSCAGNVAII